jgi:hypothetical protein
MYSCTVTNYGSRRKTFPTRIGNLFIDQLRPMEISDAKFADPRGVIEDLKVFEQSEKLGFEVVVDDENGHPSPTRQEPGIDYAAFHINELRKRAAGLGVKGVFFKKKAEIIQILEEQNGTRS